MYFCGACDNFSTIICHVYYKHTFFIHHYKILLKLQNNSGERSTEQNRTDENENKQTLNWDIEGDQATIGELHLDIKYPHKQNKHNHPLKVFKGWSNELSKLTTITTG